METFKATETQTQVSLEAIMEDELSETESEANEREDAAAMAELRKQFPDHWTPDLTAEEQAASVRIAEECAQRMGGIQKEAGGDKAQVQASVQDPLMVLSEHALHDPDAFLKRHQLKKRIPSHRLPVIVCMDEKRRIALFDTWAEANRLRTPTFAFSLEPSYKIRGFTNRRILQEVFEEVKGTATINWDIILGVIQGGHPSHFNGQGDDTKLLAERVFALRSEWDRLKSWVRSHASPRSVDDLPQDVQGDTGFSWPMELYLEYRLDKDTAIQLGRLVNSTPPGHERQRASELWSGYSDFWNEEYETDPI